jgi:hypothetical protein
VLRRSIRVQQVRAVRVQVVVSATARPVVMTLPGEIESFYMAPGVAVWASDGGTSSDSWEGVVAGMPRDQLGVWPVRRELDKTEVMVPWKQLRPRVTRALAELPAPAPAPPPAQGAARGDKKTKGNAKGKGKGKGKAKGVEVASGHSQLPNSQSVAAVEPVDAVMEILSAASSTLGRRGGIEPAALAAAHAGAAAELRPWLKMSLRSLKNSAAATGALSRGK